jgi:transposase
MNTLTDAQRERVLALLREGKSLRQIEDATGHRRETVALYGRRAGLLGGVTELRPLREPESVCEPYRDAIFAELERGESLRALHQKLVEERGFPASYSALKRFVRTAVPRGGPMMLAA